MTAAWGSTETAPLATALHWPVDRPGNIGLPVLDGYEVAARLRQSPSVRHALLLALTGYGQREDRVHAETAGFDRHFVKPADPSALLSCIETWLRARVSAGAVRTGA